MRRRGAQGVVVPADRRRRRARRAAARRSRATSPIPAGTLVVIDWGAQLDGYASDCTRTFATGELDPRDRAVYELVLRRPGGRRSRAVRPGPDRHARSTRSRARSSTHAGHAEHFGHGLGHGVGLEVHEGPRLSKQGDDALAAGQRRHGRAGRLRPRRGRRADRGPRRGHRGRPRGPQRAAEGAADRRLEPRGALKRRGRACRCAAACRHACAANGRWWLAALAGVAVHVLARAHGLRLERLRRRGLGRVRRRSSPATSRASSARLPAYGGSLVLRAPFAGRDRGARRRRARGLPRRLDPLPARRRAARGRARAAAWASAAARPARARSCSGSASPTRSRCARSRSAIPRACRSTSHTNTATATGTDDEGNTATATDTATVDLHRRGAGDRRGQDRQPDLGVGGRRGQPGRHLHLRGDQHQPGGRRPTRCRSVTLADTDGTPTFVGGDTNSDDLLEAGETWTYTLTVTLPPQDAGTSHTNTATATGIDDEGNTATATATATVTYTDVAPAIDVVKTASPTSVSEGGVGSQAVTYTYAVTNTSPAAASDPLSGVTLADTDGTPTFVGGDTNSDNLLEAGETWTYTLTVTRAAAGRRHQPHQHGDGHRHRRRGQHGHRHRHGDGHLRRRGAGDRRGQDRQTVLGVGGWRRQPGGDLHLRGDQHQPGGRRRPAVGGDAGRHRRHADPGQQRRRRRPARGGRDVDLHADRDRADAGRRAPATPTRRRPAAPTTRGTRPPPPTRRRSPTPTWRRRSTWSRPPARPRCRRAAWAARPSPTPTR